MSYNTRRATPVQQSNVGNIGSRRPQLQSNFISGGQLTPQKGGQAFNQQNQRTVQQQNQQQRQQPAAAPQKQQTVAQPQIQQPIVQQQPMAKQEHDQSMENGSEMKMEKRIWSNRKIPKKEKMKRRNQRLSRILQPKSALMILHEIVKNPTFNVIDYVSVEGTQYRATVTAEGVEHHGFGKSKTAAKNSAAENAIKHCFRQKKISSLNVSETEDQSMKMDTSTEGEEVEGPLPWQQVASFALYKLFDSWGENPNAMKEEPALKKKTAARKMPDNPATLNPVMVVNQMYPQAKFEQLAPTGATPNIVFHTQITVDEQKFSGAGNTKKVAKKNAAFAVCSTLLGVQYPPEVYNPSM